MKTALLMAAALTVSVGGCNKKVDEQEAAHTGAGTFDGEVIKSSHPKVKVGTRCEGTMTLRGFDKPGLIAVGCSGAAIDDGEGVFRNDTMDKSNPDDDVLTYRDEKTSDVDKTPGCTITAQEGQKDGSGGMLKLWDVGTETTPAFEIMIVL